ncbi:acetyl-CoA carboxylase biotin carboxyl carrier protein [Gluconobacter roseus]|uniref:acetyl-CoA carboxylase biotin carboxyl carrier protein n=1 Tax=Gluconobacter roseus TaxID=586239 RepID=UPI0038D1A1FF
MDISQIRRLIDLMAQAPIAELEIEENGRKIRLAKGGGKTGMSPVAAAPAPVEAKAPVASAAPLPVPTVPKVAETIVTAPSYGVFHLAPSPDAPPYVTIGQKVEAGQQIGLLEAMKVFNPVRATAAGVVEEILVAAGTEVDMGTPLFRLV